MLLEELKYEGPGRWEDLNTWGIDPILTELELFDSYIEEWNDRTLDFFYYDLRHKVERLRNAFYRLAQEMESTLRKPASPEAQEGGDNGGLN